MQEVAARVATVVRDQPHQVAVTRTDGSFLTYAALWHEAQSLVTALDASGARAGEVVVVDLDRVPGSISVLVAAATADISYVPLHASDPVDRRRNVLTDSGARWFIGSPDAALALGCRPVRQVGIADWVLAEVETDATPHYGGAPPLYILFTSGSTGAPKGAAISQSAVGSLLDEPRLRMSADTVMGHAASKAFDASTLEIWAPLCSGGRIAILQRNEILDRRLFSRAVEQQHITSLLLVTTVFNFLARSSIDTFARLRTLMFGGERGNPAIAREVLERTRADGLRLMHVYGPTEATVFSTIQVLDERLVDRLPIGSAVQGLTVSLRAESGAEIAGEGPGELCVSGPQLFDGYVGPGAAALNAAKHHFVERSDGTVERVYRTGDVCRLRQGLWEFVDRADSQVKVDGHRIELGEIEAAIVTHPDVVEAAVLVEPSHGKQRIVAFVAGGGSGRRLREYCATKLPPYMVPRVFVVVDSLPISGTGKIDRGALRSLL